MILNFYDFLGSSFLCYSDLKSTNRIFRLMRLAKLTRYNDSLKIVVRTLRNGSKSFSNIFSWLKTCYRHSLSDIFSKDHMFFGTSVKNDQYDLLALTGKELKISMSMRDLMFLIILFIMGSGLLENIFK